MYKYESLAKHKHKQMTSMTNCSGSSDITFHTSKCI